MSLAAGVIALPLLIPECDPKCQVTYADKGFTQSPFVGKEELINLFKEL